MWSCAAAPALVARCVQAWLLKRGTMFGRLHVAHLSLPAAKLTHLHELTSAHMCSELMPSLPFGAQRYWPVVTALHVEGAALLEQGFAMVLGQLMHTPRSSTDQLHKVEVEWTSFDLPKDFGMQHLALQLSHLLMRLCRP